MIGKMVQWVFAEAFVTICPLALEFTPNVIRINHAKNHSSILAESPSTSSDADVYRNGHSNAFCLLWVVAFGRSRLFLDVDV
jgi:hypothetical protein